ncbi:MAG: hypothetical protein IT377_16970 [Polyangiaceae bacterium]|nr:hypothetical protein [Polyangiaceae bacterium]
MSRVVVEEAPPDEQTVEGGGGGDARGVETYAVGGRGLQSGLAWDEVRTLRDLAYEGRGT